jgi:hypothetical protein
MYNRSITIRKSECPGTPTTARNLTMFGCESDVRNLASEARSIAASSLHSSGISLRILLTIKKKSRNVRVVLAKVTNDHTHDSWGRFGSPAYRASPFR